MSAIELFYSTDGKNTLKVSADTPDQLDEVREWAEKLYDSLLAKYGQKTYGSRSAPSAPAKAPAKKAAAEPRPTTKGTRDPLFCADCGKEILGRPKRDGGFETPQEISEYSTRKFGRALCVGREGCYAKAKEQEAGF